MPRKSTGPRLYLDKERGTWTIRDGAQAIRTGCTERERVAAEKILAKYLGKKHKPEGGSNPLISDVLLVYNTEHVPGTKSAKNTSYNVASLGEWWGDKYVRDISAKTCRQYASGRTGAAARRDLEVLRAALGFYHEEHGPLEALPTIVLPPKSKARSRWLTRTEAARLLWAARRSQHLRRFIALGLSTGSRPGAILRLRWDQIEMSAGIMHRRPRGEAEDARKKAPPVRLGRRILAHLRRWARQDDGIAEHVCHYDGRRVQKLRRSWKQAVLKAGLDASVTPHSLRRTRATWLMQAGVDIWEAAGSLGMTVDMLTETYAQHHPNWQKKASEV